LAMVYIGLETGNEALLKKYDKGVTVEQIIEHTLRAKAAGMITSITAINGMGGKEQSEIHAIETAQALSRIKPDYIAMLTLRVYTGTPLHDWIEHGELTMLGPKELAAENRILLQHIDSEGSIFRSNHASNYLPLKGTLNRDREALIEQIDRALAGEVRFRRAVELGL
ncbi:MAG: radical SAM protein, partial [Oscillospiraceae bacterium]|nr:radical SAM protein [Oscillospiraceae bacterium]